MPTTPLGGILPNGETEAGKVATYNEYLMNVLEPRVGWVGEKVSTEVSITAAATLTSSAYGKMHVITGTSADYTITLFTPVSADLGKMIGFRVADAGTKRYTLDAAGSETIDGKLTFPLSRNDVIYLKAIATTGVTWQILGYKMSPAEVRVYHNANQSIADATATALAFNSERWDTDVIHDTVTNNTRLTCKTPGKYDIKGHAGFAANAVGFRALLIRLNGTTYIDLERTLNLGVVEAAYLGISTVYDLVVGDYLELMAEQNSGGSLNVLAAGNYTPEFMMTRAG